jgi:quercetin 2,3-dioxygenase
MLEIRKGNERGYADHGWLQSYHSFTFASYYDPRHMGFGPLRVINEDRVSPGRGFGTHGHRDMEIISYVLAGTLAHQDTLGNGSSLHYGDVQCMSAGRGVMHSEFNRSGSEPLHFLQIWIEPNVAGIAPNYEEAHFDAASKHGKLCTIASPDGRDGSMRIHQDAVVYATILGTGARIAHALAPGRLAYVHVVRGKVAVNGLSLVGGDALKIADLERVSLEDGDDAEVLVFDLPR